MSAAPAAAESLSCCSDTEIAKCRQARAWSVGQDGMEGGRSRTGPRRWRQREPLPPSLQRDAAALGARAGAGLCSAGGPGVPQHQERPQASAPAMTQGWGTLGTELAAAPESSLGQGEAQRDGGHPQQGAAVPQSRQAL